MKAWRVIRWLFALALIPLLIAIATGGWLLRSDSGRDWLLLRVNTVLPAGATLRWEHIDGTLAGPLEIRGLHYVDGDLRFDAARLRIDHGLWPLLSRRLDIHSLELEHAQLSLPKNDKPFELPRWPDILPKLDLPLTVTVTKLSLNDLQVSRAGQSLIHIDSVDAAGSVGVGALDLDHLDLASDRGSLHLTGTYAPRDHFRTQLAGDALLTVVGGSPTRAVLKASGDLDDFRLALDANAPEPLTLRLALKDGSSTPHWSFEGKSERLLLESFGLPADQPLSFDLQATGQSGDAQLQGRIKRGELTMAIAPSRLRLDAGVITLDPLLVDLVQGRVRVAGTLALEGENPRFDLRVGSTALRLDPQAGTVGSLPVLAHGDAQIAGLLRDWTLKGDAGFSRGRDKATLTLAGHGDAQQLKLDSLLAKSPTGVLQGKGELRWQPRLAANLNATLAGFDPGYFFPDYPGALTGKLMANGEQRGDDRWQGDLRVDDLSGSLRQRALAGRARLHWDGSAGDGEIRLGIGNSRVDASGRIGDRVDVQANFAPLDLADVFADASGRVRGHIEINGARSAPGYVVDLQGDELHWAGLASATFRAQGRLPASGRDGHLQLSANKLTLAGENFDTLAVTLTGSVSALHARGDIAGDIGRLGFDGSANGAGENRQGQIQSLRLAPKVGPVWSLSAPAKYRYAAGSLRLDRACLQATAPGGNLCLQANGEQAALTGEHLPLALLAPLLADPTLKPFGEAALEGHFARRAGAWGGTLALRSAEGGLRLDPTSPREVVSYSDLHLDAQLQGESLGVKLAAQLPEKGSISGELHTGLRGDATLAGELTLDINRLDWLELFSVDLANPKGRIDGHLLIGGRVAAPTLSGQAKLSAFVGELPGLGVKLHEGEILLRGDASGQTRISGQVTSGAGRLLADGLLDLGNKEKPLQLRLHGDNITAADTSNFEAVISPDLDLAYGHDVLQLRGVVTVPSARVDLERLDSSLSASPDVVVLDPRDPAGVGTFLVDTDVEVRLGDQVRLKGFGLDGRIGGALRLRDQPGRAPIANGTLDVRGKYTAYGQALQIRQGRLTYVNAAYDNPVLDIRAERVIENITVGVRVRGTALAPETAVTSSPAMQPTEALSWLVFGRPLTSTNGDEARSLSASAMALGAGGNLIAQQLGAKLGLDQAGIAESQALGGATLSIGKRISPKLFLSYGISLIGTGQVITLKYLIRRGFNLQLESGTESAASLNWRKEK
ncbi:MAG TPA: translocation/assembly module TamB domain-containing protein [Arenimonas sp.]|uniref:translocation/assembly module TamB domain-containing protein n=1 Tax=Arenimonas sp. TaxID=1872635 RepID=UPI002BD2EB72|nr:translocation/assembly module TamB domain-containing protein [Arenimonas sp.]HMB57687.1 translocation/assembly module TamB domain-containing protein [Arenimonas sp.]